ncbi:sigma-54-dependent Fis family transcriptional regulator [Geotalea sp. SG265]|uniref:sigma-54-dependent Fis family transcriptional regulator n=1 Tax=Geotalea sp. SG265 TaxID=2922867 RepID=UPI001FAFCDD3|nr:sigma-54-dependent Fis family transcriptional regulator [Geotalea sp. SG265]
MESNHLDVQLLRPEVASSWERCRNLNVNPFQEADGYVNQLELRERLYRKQHLLKVARPFMDNLYNFVKGSGFQVVLTDEHGFLLEVLGDNDIVTRTRHVLLCPGGNWSESQQGTNAIGTAIVEKKPVQIYAWEHYCQSNHFLTCSAAPIFSPEGEIIGILDISGDYRVANAHTLGMVVAAVNAIENQLRLQKATDKLYMAYRYSNTLLENMSDGLISINNNGIVTEMNAKAGEILGCNPTLAKGRHVEQIYNARHTLLQVLNEGTEYEDREIIIENIGRKIYSSATLLRDDSGGIIGAVAVFREMNNRQPVKRPTILQSHSYTFDHIIGTSPAITAAKEWAKTAAASPSTVLIRGESGTGKELFAQAIHNASPRCDRQFIALNCAALPETLIESELFGYEEGTFTGARKGGRAGKFEVADGGTIFLDEIGDLSPNVQAKLLRVIQEKKVARIGSSNERGVDIRIIAATHKDLNEEVQLGNFRQDLYYRLNVLEITIPPLRDRGEDLPVLATHLIEKTAAKLDRKVPTVESGVMEKLQAYGWPGNIRELENVIERAVIRAGSEGALTRELFQLQAEAVVKTEPAQVAVKEIKSLREMECEMIVEALAFFDGNIQKAAAKLGIGRNTLYRKMKEYGISS